jgi:hypothetical protein
MFSSKEVRSHYFPQLLHRYGQPPSEIVMEIAPGLELDVDGAPKMDLLHGGEECRIM